MICCATTRSRAFKRKVVGFVIKMSHATSLLLHGWVVTEFCFSLLTNEMQEMCIMEIWRGHLCKNENKALFIEFSGVSNRSPNPPGPKLHHVKLVSSHWSFELGTYNTMVRVLSSWANNLWSRSY